MAGTARRTKGIFIGGVPRVHEIVFLQGAGGARRVMSGLRFQLLDLPCDRGVRSWLRVPYGGSTLLWVGRTNSHLNLCLVHVVEHLLFR